MYIATNNKLPTTTATAAAGSTSTSNSISGSSITTSAMSPLPFWSSSSSKKALVMSIIVLMLINIYPSKNNKFTTTILFSSLASNSSNSTLSSTDADADADIYDMIMLANGNVNNTNNKSSSSSSSSTSSSPTTTTIKYNDNEDDEDDYNDQYYNQYLDEGTSLRCIPLSGIFTFPDVIDNHTAVCEFQPNKSPYSSHFPHTMQQLYPCFSWWNNARNQNKRNVLIMNTPIKKGKEFVNGFMMALANNTSSFDLLVDKIEEYKKFNSSVHVGNKPGGAYKMHHPNDASMMRQIILDYYNITSSVVENYSHFNHNNNNLTILPTAADEVECKKELGTPVIGFLNRHISSGRYVTNHASIIKALEEELYPNNNKNSSEVTATTTTTTSAGVHYLSSFDGLSFQEQIAFMHKIDILIGPHGAQLTSVPFIPECGGILELFSTGYYKPGFFGSLSRSTGHYHISYYTGNITNRVEEVLVGSQTIEARIKSRGNYINADPNVIIHGVKKLISNWQTCHCLTQVEKDACIW